MQKFATFLWFDDQADDAVKLRLLPHLELAMLPRTEHMELTTRTSWLVPMKQRISGRGDVEDYVTRRKAGECPS